jgi:FkbM family methyltransferase
MHDRTTSFAQYGQDLFVLELLGLARNGFFLDSGAADGVRSSNTYLLESSFQWNGICVEPNRTLFTGLVQNRRCHCLCCALYDSPGEVDFLDAGFLGGIISEYHNAHLGFAMTRGTQAGSGARPVRVSVPAKTLRTVLEECAAPRIVDYWSLDTEGSELALLRSFPFDEFRVGVLTVEHNWLPVRDEIRRFLEARGYVRIRELGCDDGYAHGELVGAAWRSAALRSARAPRTRDRA